jgi:hypothetical protein
MPIEPVDQLLESVPGSEVWSGVVEDHLDAHPMPVDSAEVDRIAARLERRIRGPRRWPIAVAVVLAIAAAALFVAVPFVGGPVETVAPAPVAAPALVPSLPMEVRVHAVPGPLERSTGIVVGPDARVISSVVDRTAVLLVQEGEVDAVGRTVTAGNWVLVTQLEDGTTGSLVFADGEAAPVLNRDVWDAQVPRQLEAVRWQALPDETLDALDSLLEAP